MSFAQFGTLHLSVLIILQGNSEINRDDENITHYQLRDWVKKWMDLLLMLYLKD